MTQIPFPDKNDHYDNLTKLTTYFLRLRDCSNLGRQVIFCEFTGWLTTCISLGIYIIIFFHRELFLVEHKHIIYLPIISSDTPPDRDICRITTYLQIWAAICKYQSLSADKCRYLQIFLVLSWLADENDHCRQDRLLSAENITVAFMYQLPWK